MKKIVPIALLFFFRGPALLAEDYQDSFEKADDASKKSANWKAQSLGAAAAELATGQLDKAAMHFQQAQAAQVGEEKNRAIAEKVRQEDAADGMLGAGQTKVITIGREIHTPGSPPAGLFPGNPNPSGASTPAPATGSPLLPSNETPDFSVIGSGGSPSEFAPSAPEPAVSSVEARTPASFEPAQPPVGAPVPSAATVGVSPAIPDASDLPAAATLAPAAPLPGQVTLLDALRDRALSTAEAEEAPPKPKTDPAPKAKERRPRTLR